MKHLFPLLLSIFSLLGVSAMAAERPNIVLIFTDDHGYGDVSTYHESVIRTQAQDSWGYNGPWRGGKQDHYDGGLRVPFMSR